MDNEKKYFGMPQKILIRVFFAALAGILSIGGIELKKDTDATKHLQASHLGIERDVKNNSKEIDRLLSSQKDSEREINKLSISVKILERGKAYEPRK